MRARMNWIRNDKLGVLVWLFFLILGGYAIVHTPFVPFADQGISGYRLSWSEYPQLSNGVVSYWIIGVINAIFDGYRYCVGAASDPQYPFQSNEWVRWVVFAFYLTSAWILTRATQLSSFGGAVFLGMVFFSRFGLIWLSSEVIVGGFVMLSLAAILGRASPVGVGIVLGLLALTKPDVVVLSGCLGLYTILLVEKDWSRRKQLIAAGLATFLVFQIPGVLAHGWAKHFDSGARAFLSFGQHYAVLLQKHQLNRDLAPHPWEHWYQYVQSNFPGAQTFSDIVRIHPSVYYDFVFLSLGRLIYVIYFLIKPFFLASILLAGLGFARKSALNGSQVFWWFLPSFLPLVLLTSAHFRYFSRYFPVFALILILGATREMKNIHSASLKLVWARQDWKTLGSIAFIVLLAIGIGQTTSDAFWEWKNWRPGVAYWFPD